VLVPGDMVIIGKYELRFNDGHAPAAHGAHAPKKAPAPPPKPNLNVEEPTESYELWFYAVDGEQKGPVDVATLRKLVRDKTISPESLVWHAGMTDWIPAKDAPGVASPENPPALQEEAPPAPAHKPAPEIEKPKPAEKAA